MTQDPLSTWKCLTLESGFWKSWMFSQLHVNWREWKGSHSLGCRTSAGCLHGSSQNGSLYWSLLWAQCGSKCSLRASFSSLPVLLIELFDAKAWYKGILEDTPLPPFHTLLKLLDHFKNWLMHPFWDETTRQRSPAASPFACVLFLFKPRSKAKMKERLLQPAAPCLRIIF